MKDPSIIMEKDGLNLWTIEIEADFDKMIIFLSNAKSLLSEDGKLHSKLRNTQYVSILNDTEETIREVSIILRRIEIFYEKYNKSSNLQEDFLNLKNYSHETFKIINFFKTKWNTTTSKIEIASRIIKG